jgi:F0F1-type ATP synthase membrane subunit b/b'
MRAAVEQEIQAAERRAQEAARAAVEREVQAAERRVQEAAPAAAEDSAQTPVEAGRAARGNASPRFQKERQQVGAALRRVGAHLRNIVPTALTAVITAAAVAIFANDYYTSRIADWARRGTSPVLTEVALERESRVQGLTWILRKSVGLDDIGAHAQLVLGQAASSPAEFNDWVRGQGGIDVDASFIKLTVTGNRQAGITITGMQAKVDKRELPLHGAFFYAPPEGERENAQIGFDLDEAVPVARLVEPNKNFGDRGYLGGDYFMDKSVDLALGEQQVFNVVAMTTNYYYAWHIEMEVKAGGRTKYVPVDLRRDKKLPSFPFEISARADPRDNNKGNFAVYKELYVLDRSAGFRPVDPKTYAP